MTRTQFAEAAAKRRRVRLIDRSRTFHVDEWYEPIVGDDGTLGLETRIRQCLR